MTKLSLVLLFVSVYLWTASQVVYADYVLPYPSYMPGHRLYKFSRILDGLKAYWYWGTLSKIKYHLFLADKYLVEAKTLFEYRQYLLASDALRRSTEQFGPLSGLIKKAGQENKDTTRFESIIYDAGLEHIRTITELISLVPSEFTWTPEKAEAIHLPLKEWLEDARRSRQVVVSALPTH